MKIFQILQLILVSIFGILFRIIFYYSKYKDYLKSLLIFDQSPYNFDNLKENYIYNLFHKVSSIQTKDNGFSKDNISNNLPDTNYYSEYEFISKPLALLYQYIRNYPKEYIFSFFIICDLLIAYLISTFKYHSSTKNDDIKKENDNDNNNDNKEYKLNLGAFCFYLSNPVSITTCISFNLDVVFTLINLLLAYFADNLLLCPILATISIIISPGYIFITLIYFIFLLNNNFRKYIHNILITIALLLLYFKFAIKLDYLPLESIKNLYYNYYWFKDIRPNFGLLWVLLPSTFLKYQNYTIMMFLIYQFTLSSSVTLSVNRIQSKHYNYKKSLIYILIFYISHIIDRYPCENHLVVILCILLQHYEIINVKYFDLGIYCSFASYDLIVCRGFLYTHRRSGSSNYLFFQNLTYAVSQIMIIMFSLKGINDFINKCIDLEKKENEEKDIMEVNDEINIKENKNKIIETKENENNEKNENENKIEFITNNDDDMKIEFITNNDDDMKKNEEDKKENEMKMKNEGVIKKHKNKNKKNKEKLKIE